MRIKDLVLITLLVISGIVFAKTVTTIMFSIGYISVTNDIRFVTISSIIFGLLIGLSIGIVLNIKTRKSGLFVIGFLSMFVYDYSRIFPFSPKDLALGILCGAIVSMLSIFKLITVNIQKVFRYLLFTLFAPLIYLLFAHVGGLPIEQLQNNIIILIMFIIIFVILAKVVK